MRGRRARRSCRRSARRCGAPSRERRARPRGTAAASDETTAPRDVGEQRAERERQEHLVRGPDEHEHARSRRRAPRTARSTGAAHRAREQQRPDGETGREHRVARGLVVERRVRGIDEEQERGEERGNASEDQRRRAPGEDRDGVQQRRTRPRAARSHRDRAAAPTTIGVSGVRKTWSSESGGAESKSWR